MPSILLLMLPAPWDVSIVEVTVLWTEEVGQERGSDSPKVAQLVVDGTASPPRQAGVEPTFLTTVAPDAKSSSCD